MRIFMGQRVRRKEKAEEKPLLPRESGNQICSCLLIVPTSPPGLTCSLCSRYVPGTVPGLEDIVNTVHRGHFPAAQCGEAKQPCRHRAIIQCDSRSPQEGCASFPDLQGGRGILREVLINCDLKNELIRMLWATGNSPTQVTLNNNEQTGS